MDVVTHQTIGVNLHAMLGRQLAKMKQIENSISVATKARASVRGPLNEMRRHARQKNPQLTRHNDETPLADDG